jgi:hypothetical protein
MAPLRTTPAKGRNLTAELVARVERFEPDPGPEPGTTGAEAATGWHTGLRRKTTSSNWDS